MNSNLNILTIQERQRFDFYNIIDFFECNVERQFSVGDDGVAHLELTISEHLKNKFIDALVDFLEEYKLEARIKKMGSFTDYKFNIKI